MAKQEKKFCRAFFPVETRSIFLAEDKGGSLELFEDGRAVEYKKIPRFKAIVDVE